MKINKFNHPSIAWVTSWNLLQTIWSLFWGLGVGEYRLLSHKKFLCIGENQFFQVKKLWICKNFFKITDSLASTVIDVPPPISFLELPEKPASQRQKQPAAPLTFHNTMGPDLFIYLFFHPSMHPWHWKPFFTTIHFNTLYLTSHVVFKF